MRIDASSEADRTRKAAARVSQEAEKIADLLEDFFEDFGRVNWKVQYCGDDDPDLEELEHSYDFLRDVAQYFGHYAETGE